jgi:hypothetical protein
MKSAIRVGLTRVSRDVVMEWKASPRFRYSKCGYAINIENWTNRP